MNLKGFKSQSEAERYLRKHKRERKKLGLKRTPDQAMISKFINHYLTDEIKEVISYIGNKIMKVAKELDIELDVINKEKKKQSTRKKSNKQYYLDRKSEEAIKELKQLLIYTKLLKIRFNRVYDLREYLNMLIHIIRRHAFIESGAKSYRKTVKKNRKREICDICGKSILHPLQNKIKKDWAKNYIYCPVCGHQDRLSPSGEALLKHIESNFGSIEKLMRSFRILFEKIWQRTKKYNLFRKPVNISIDETDIPFYGDINTIGVEGMKPKSGTYFGYKLYTVYVSKYGRRYTLCSLPLLKLRLGIPESKYLFHQNKILKQLLEFAKQKVIIKHVLIDNGFFGNESFKIIERMGFKFLTIVKDNQKKIIRETEKLPSHTVIVDYPLEDIKINIFVIKRIKKVEKKPWKTTKVIWRYATNITPLEDKNKWVDMMVKLYPKRWGIETSYRKMKEDFFLKTRSKKYIIRLFLYEIVILLYNLWIYANIYVSMSLYNEMEQYPVIDATSFIDDLFDIDPGG
jgi:hypothetical protein